MPSKRLEAIACDAELQEKPLADLRRLCDMIKQRCKACLGEQAKENDINNDETSTGRFRF